MAFALAETTRSSPYRIGCWIVSDKVILRLIVIRTFDGVVVCLLAISVDGHYSVVEGIALNRFQLREKYRLLSPKKRIGMEGFTRNSWRPKLAYICHEVFISASILESFPLLGIEVPLSP